MCLQADEWAIARAVDAVMTNASDPAWEHPRLRQRVRRENIVFAAPTIETQAIDVSLTLDQHPQSIPRPYDRLGCFLPEETGRRGVTEIRSSVRPFGTPGLCGGKRCQW